MKLFEPPGGCAEERSRCVWLSGPRIAYSSRSLGVRLCGSELCRGPHAGKKVQKGAKKRMFKEDSGVKMKRENKSTPFGLFKKKGTLRRSILLLTEGRGSICLAID